MNVTFQIEYFTTPGETICIVGNQPSLGNGDPTQALALHSTNGHTHHAHTEITPHSNELRYRYFVRRADGSTRQEWGSDRCIYLSSGLTSVDFHDRWQDDPSDKPFYSQAFTDCIARRKTSPETPLKPNQIRICVEAPMLMPTQALAICGSCEALGNWNPAEAPQMQCTHAPQWSITLPATALRHGEVEFKFIAIDSNTSTLLGWEKGENRHIALHNSTSTSVVISGLHFENPLPLWRGAGVAIPVFSLRTTDDFGVGDFYDLLELIDWAAGTNQRMIQILPINDTTMTRTWMDSYPYNANSCFALHPLYLRLEALGQLSDTQERHQFTELKRHLNSLPEVDYEQVSRAKERYSRLLFAEHGSNDLKSEDFNKFFAANSHWLKPYAAYCILRDKHNTANTRHWGSYADYSPSRTDQVLRENQPEANFVYYIQFHLDKQLRHVRETAHRRGVALKGDIPIGISRDSVDAWMQPELFNLNMSAGAPPDDFAILGQNWGFPTYNWDVMARDNFAWWRARFRKMAEYFDAYRIDHVLGFFRIWQIPLNAIHGLLGYFNRALPLSPAEMHTLFGFNFESAGMTSPYIDDDFICETFGNLSETVKKDYLTPCGNGRYKLHPNLSTQQAIATHFARTSQQNSIELQQICRGLLLALDQVLFIEDPYTPGHYHPRITAYTSAPYRALTEEQRHCFDALYHDFYYKRNNNFWRDSALWKLPPLIDSTRMLVCAEDLGMIPACVAEVMDRLRILSLEVHRMPKEPFAPYGTPSRYPYFSVCTTSTHDMSGLRGWWEESPENADRFYREALHSSGTRPTKATGDICRQIIEMHLQSPSMLCILPLQDWLSIDESLRRSDATQEQINFPGNSRHYWRYRMHLTINELRGASTFNATLRKLIANSGR